MKEKIKTQEGFIQIPLLIGIIISIVVTAGVGYGAFEYNKTSKMIKEAAGRFKIYVVDTGGKYNKKEFSKIKFKISQNSHIPVFSGGPTIFESLDREF